MPTVAELDLPHLDYLDPELRGPAFEAALERLASAGWLAASPYGPVVLAREPAERLLRSRSVGFPGVEIAELLGVTDGPLHEEVVRNIINLEAADHGRLRALVAPSFTPRAAERWRPAMRTFLAQLWSGPARAGRCELVGELARPYPALTVASVMGAPLADADRLATWSALIQQQFSADLPARRAEIERAVEQFYIWADELLARRRADPGEDLVSQLIRAEAEGDRLADVELVNLVLNVLVGGVDTTQAQLAHALRLFAAHPDQWELLAARPELVGAAVEEVLRYAPITPFTARIVREQIELEGVTFPPGTLVMVCAHSANREVPGPPGFDIAADRGGARLLTFGAGIHYCLGANLARAELEEALAFLAPRMRDLRLEGEVAYGSILGIYDIEALPLRFSPADPSPV